MFGGMRKSTWVNGEGRPPVVLAMWKLNPIVVEAPSLSGENEAFSVTVWDARAPRGASKHPQTSSAKARRAPRPALGVSALGKGSSKLAQ